MFLKSEFYFQISVDNIQELPLGSIIPWIKRVSNENGTEIAHLPEGWQRCDGSQIELGIWKGKTTPNLNGERRFLRGGLDTDMLTLEDDQLEDHLHKDGGHSHNCSATSKSTPHNHRYRETNREIKVSGGAIYRVQSASDDNWYQNSVSSTEVTVHTTCSLGPTETNMEGVDDQSKSGEETRPRNMNVIFIIRIY